MRRSSVKYVFKGCIGKLRARRDGSGSIASAGGYLNFQCCRIVATLEGQENAVKTTDTITEQQADEEAVNEYVSTGKPLDPEVYRRVRARAEKITAELRWKNGDMNISTDLIREVRDEE
jgi:hypothetical protein